ncbi:unnamed protein product [Closterium sp. Naga37s-1]|nr:unnamed protein product [Closterium sp. Naga37s-1]
MNKEKGTKKKGTEKGDDEGTAGKEEEAAGAKRKTKETKKQETVGGDTEACEGDAGIPWKKLIRQQLKAAPSHELPLKALRKQVLAAAKRVLAEQSSKESAKDSCKQGAGKGRGSSSKEELLAAFQRSVSSLLSRSLSPS